jgi:protein involved in polysaccharide export with SLBB domain
MKYDLNKILTLTFVYGFSFLLSGVSQAEILENFAAKSVGEASVFPSSVNTTTKHSPTEPVIYGFDLFSLKRVDDEAMGTPALPADYILGAGDQLGIYLLGSEPIQFEVVINVEGKIFIPSVGVVTVAGLTLTDFRTLLSQKIARYYSNYTIDLMLLNPKYIRVAVVGDVNQPGNYAISALSSVLDAVIKAGGPTLRGSLRNIQLFRQEKLVAQFDLYNFLMKGECRQNVLLENGDRIFIPLMQARVMVSGAVRRPAVFELNPANNENLADLIKLAGDFTEVSDKQKIEISRLESDGNRTVEYFNFSAAESDSTKPFSLIKNQDEIYVYSILDQRHQPIVSIYGEVNRPGAYSWQNEMRVSDLILKAGSTSRSAFLLTAELAKIDPLHPVKIVKINLQEILNDRLSQENPLLEEDDVVFIRKIPEWEIGPTIEVRGEVKFSGIYAISRDSTRLSEILRQAGGFTKDALIREAVVIRKSTRTIIDKEYERLKTMPRDQMSDNEYEYFVMKQNMQDIGHVLVNFHKLFVQGDQSEDIFLQNTDIIEIPKVPKVVLVTGCVSKPGGVIFHPSENLKYYLKKAGGSTWDADVKNTKVTKVTGEILKYRDVKDFVAGDIIWVPRKPHRNWWEIFRDTVAVAAQLATVALIVERF